MADGNYLRSLWHNLSQRIPDADRDFRRPSAMVVTTQLAIASVLGLFALLSFSILLKKLPRLYASRKYKNNGALRLPSWNERRLFGWLAVLIKIKDDDILEYAGLDAYVFLSFFKMCIKLLFTFSVFSIGIIAPVRYYFTGYYDGDDSGDVPSEVGSSFVRGYVENGHPQSSMTVEPVDVAPETANLYLWMYVIFTYFFTILTIVTLIRQTTEVVNTRQQYLGKLNTITDRTIRVAGIPPELRDVDALKKRIEELKIGKVSSITICREWGPLNRLFKYRRQVLRKLELAYAECPPHLRTDEAFEESFGLYRSTRGRINDDRQDIISSEPHSDPNLESTLRECPIVAQSSPIDTVGGSRDSGEDGDDDNDDVYSPLLSKGRPRMRTGLFGLFGPRVDAIEYLSRQLKYLDHEILEARKKHYPATPTAFVTMDSVANAQMAAQAVLDPRVHYFITRLAPAPHDIKWDHIGLSRREYMRKVYTVTVFIGISSVFLIIPVSYLATLLNLKTISKFWPKLGELLANHLWAENIVTGLLPTYLFTLLNVGIPFLYEYLTSKQGFPSYSDEEISLVSKNFFYIFVNLFLVFTLAGTASNYWAYLSDTTKIAYQLATSVKEFSLFYVDLIIFQGIGMFPFKLLLAGSLIGFPLVKIQAKTPRQRLELYKPPVFNFGLQLPQPILILIITLIYSVMSTRIIVSGLVYFVIGYYVYKYQLIYATDHLPHSTGKVWPLIYRRILVGLLLFQLTMAGTLAGFQGGWVLSSWLFPLPLLILSAWWDFHKNYLPLLQYIALSAIREHERDNSMIDSPGVDPGTYEYPYLVDGLERPMIE